MTRPDLSTPLRNPGVVFSEEFDGWGVLFDPRTSGALSINPVGVMVWQLMDGQRNLDDIVRGVKDCCEDVPDGVAHDVCAFVCTLGERGFARHGSVTSECEVETA